MASVKSWRHPVMLISEKCGAEQPPLPLGCLCFPNWKHPRAPLSTKGRSDHTLLVRGATSTHSSKTMIYEPVALNSLENTVHPSLFLPQQNTVPHVLCCPLIHTAPLLLFVRMEDDYFFKPKPKPNFVPMDRED